jgi:predicted nucleic acid-binding protein
MEIVIDTSAIMAVLVDEPDRARVLEVTQGATLRAPGSVHWEVGNAFSAMFKKRRISKEKALKAVARYHLIPIIFSDIELGSALALAARHNMYAYDAYILACAQYYRLPVLSLDTAMIRMAKTIGLDVIDL